MALTKEDKQNINKYLTKTTINYIYYNSLLCAINNPNCNHYDIFNYLLSLITQEFNSKNVNIKLFHKILIIIKTYYEIMPTIFNVHTIKTILTYKNLYLDYLNKNHLKENHNIINILDFLDAKLTTYYSDLELNLTEYNDYLTELKKLEYLLNVIENNPETNKIEEQKQIISKLKTKITILKDNISHNSILNYYTTSPKEHLIKTKDFLKSKIISILLTNYYTLNDLHKILIKNNFYISINDLEKILQLINQEIKIIDSQNMTYPPIYHVYYPNIITNASFNILNSQNYFDIILTSDFHLQNLNNHVKKRLNLLYDYATTNNISLIINLGDFFNGYETIANLNISQFEKQTKNLISNIINDFPQNGITKHILLGGNHDERLLLLGLNPLKIISEARPDFINIGYYTARIIFNNIPDIGFNLIHKHPKRFYKTPADIPAIINNSMQDLQVTNDNTYLNFIGHYHINVLNIPENYCIVPSLFYSKYQNGAWHLKIYFNNKEIDHIILKSLTIKDQIAPTSEIVYTKKRILKQ